MAPAWFLAPFAALIAWTTSRRLEAARLEYSGQLLAKIGLLLALIALVCAPARYYTKRILLARESRAVANEYLDALLEYRVDDAYRLMAPAFSQGQPLDEIVSKLGRDNYQKYREQPVVVGLQGKGKDVLITYLDEIYGDTRSGIDEVFHRYLVTVEQKGAPPKKQMVMVALTGAVSPDGSWDGRVWTVNANTMIADAAEGAGY